MRAEWAVCADAEDLYTVDKGIGAVSIRRELIPSLIKGRGSDSVMRLMDYGVSGTCAVLRLALRSGSKTC
jgi:hypothetical protein